MLRSFWCGAYLLILSFLSLAITVVLVSCSASAPDEIFNNPGETVETEKIPVEFNCSLPSGWKDLSTRAKLDDYVDYDFTSGDVIGVFGYEIQISEDGKEIRNPSPNVAYNLELSRNTAKEWEKSSEVYWPKNSKVRFGGVYPFDYYSDGLYSNKPQIIVSDFDPETPAIIEIIPDGTVDIRIAEDTEIYSIGKPVDLMFKHILQKVVMTFKLELDTENSKNYEYSGKVSHMIFKNLKRKYTLTIPSSDTNGWSDISLDQDGGYESADNDNYDLKIPLKNVVLDSEQKEFMAEEFAYLPPGNHLDNMYVEINGIEYRITSNVNLPILSAGNVLHLTIKINTIGTNVTCSISDWKILEHKEDTIQ